jgi:hypothetical protein
MDRVSKDAIPAIPSIIGETASTKRGGADHRGSNWLLCILMGLCSTTEMLNWCCCWEGKVEGPKETFGIFVFGGLLLFFRTESGQGVNIGQSQKNGFLVAAAGGNVVPHNNDGETRAAAIVWEADEGKDDSLPANAAPPPPPWRTSYWPCSLPKLPFPPLPSIKQWPGGRVMGDVLICLPLEAQRGGVRAAMTGAAAPTC